MAGDAPAAWFESMGIVCKKGKGKKAVAFLKKAPQKTSAPGACCEATGTKEQKFFGVAFF